MNRNLDNCDCKEEDRLHTASAMEEYGGSPLSVCLKCGRVYFPKHVIEREAERIKNEMREAKEHEVREAEYTEKRRQEGQDFWQREIQRTEDESAKRLAILRAKKEQGAERPPYGVIPES